MAGERDLFDGRIQQLKAELERVERSRQFTQEWYSMRWQRLADLLRDYPNVWTKAACIMANGTAEMTEPPTYAQQMNLLRHRAERAEREREGIEAGWLAWKGRAERAEAEVQRLRAVLERIAAFPTACSHGPMAREALKEKDDCHKGPAAR